MTSTTGGSMDSQTVESLLARVELFRQLDADSLAMLAQRAKQRTVPKGMFVFVQDEPGDRMFVMVEGMVKLFVLFPSGEIIELVRKVPTGSFGEVALLDGGSRTATAEAVEQTRLLEIARDDLVQLLRDRPDTTDALLRSLGAIIRRTTDQVTELAFLSLQGRVARRLLLLVESFEDAEVRGISQADLASMVGGSRQSVNAVLKSFEKRGFIAMSKGRVAAIHDRTKLEGLAKR
jgi:CRP/FNR family transcriptional regulator, cyclic AMP receptor protein